MKANYNEPLHVITNIVKVFFNYAYLNLNHVKTKEFHDYYGEA
jgi:hypothetical protein